MTVMSSHHAASTSPSPYENPNFKMIILLIVFSATVSGCATSRDSQQSCAPTVSGYISTGAESTFDFGNATMPAPWSNPTF